MINSAFNLLANAGDFLLKSADTRLQFIQRQRVQILAGQFSQNNIRFALQIIFNVHAS